MSCTLASDCPSVGATNTLSKMSVAFPAAVTGTLLFCASTALMEVLEKDGLVEISGSVDESVVLRAPLSIQAMYGL
jgi:hypothetical protein